MCFKLITKKLKIIINKKLKRIIIELKKKLNNSGYEENMVIHLKYRKKNF